MTSRNENWNSLVDAYKAADIEFPDLKVVTLAQWALESNWGASRLSTEHHNFGGLKYRARMKGYAEPVDYEAHDGRDTYCHFDNYEEFIKGYWHFIQSGPYDGWKDYGGNSLGYISHIYSKGYAADPSYVVKVTRIYNELMEEYGEDMTDAERPPNSFFGDNVIPVFEKVNGVEHRKRGRYTNNIEGLIVHYDAFRIKRTNVNQENSDSRSIQMLGSGENNGYRYGIISRTGRIFVPENWDWENWGYHAGTSRCPLTDRTGVSRYYVGFEMNNPGLLYQAQEDGVFCPWYNSKRNSGGSVILDSRGRCTRVTDRDEWYTYDEVRYAQGDNITRGYYLPYTEDQFNSLVAIIAFLKDKFPNHFDINKVFGHDEVSPRRKQDPGGALAYDGRLMTMPQFRQFLFSSM